MSTKLLNIELSMEEYIPVKPLLDRIFAGDWDRHATAVRYVAAIANIQGTYIHQLDAVSIAYIKVEMRRKRNGPAVTKVMITLAIPEETE